MIDMRKIPVHAMSRRHGDRKRSRRRSRSATGNAILKHQQFSRFDAQLLRRLKINVWSRFSILHVLSSQQKLKSRLKIKTTQRFDRKLAMTTRRHALWNFVLF